MREEELKTIAKEIRREVLEALYRQGGHVGSAFSVVELLVALYFGGVLRYDPQRPDWEERDYFLLSNGHACPTYYAVLRRAGFLKQRVLEYKKMDSGLEGHPVRGSLAGVEISSGSLGMGLSVGVGLALGLKREGRKNRVVVMMSDGEQQEGEVWEAAMAASHFRVDNLTAVIDRNRIQIGGWTEEQMALEPLDEKYRSFGWEVLKIDGHSFGEILTAFEEAKKVRGKPVVIVAETVPCKGVWGLEGSEKGHHPKISEEIYQRSLEGLR